MKRRNEGTEKNAQSTEIISIFESDLVVSPTVRPCDVMHITVIRHLTIKKRGGSGLVLLLNFIQAGHFFSNYMKMTKTKHNSTNFLFTETAYILNLSNQQRNCCFFSLSLFISTVCNSFWMKCKQPSERNETKKTTTKEFTSERLKTPNVHDLRLHRNVSVTSYSYSRFAPFFCSLSFPLALFFSRSLSLSVCACLLHYFALDAEKCSHFALISSIVCIDSIKIEWERKITRQAQNNHLSFSEFGGMHAIQWM